MISYLLFRSASHTGDDSSVSCDIGTHWTAQTGKLNRLLIEWHLRTSAEERGREVLSVETPLLDIHNLANRALDCSILAFRQTLSALHPITIFFGHIFYFHLGISIEFSIS